jgi:peptide/nickel transport system substrate-binding protein
MKKTVILSIFSFLIVAALMLASCVTKTTSTPTSTATSIPTTKSTTPGTAPTTTKPTTSTSTPVTGGKWWDSLGVPQYGGDLVLANKVDINNFDPIIGTMNSIVYPMYMELLHADDWTLNPSVFNYTLGYRPNEFQKGNLAESWEFTEPGTYILHLRKGIRWQNISPANGREFVADDVTFHFQRQGGYDIYLQAPYTDKTALKDVISITAKDKYTVVFKWKLFNQEAIMENIQRGTGTQCLENPDAVKLWGDVSDWRHAIGTGPFILKDYVPASSVTLTKNPGYWAYDERYPQNQLPYIDNVKFLIIPNDATTLAAVRTGKIDLVQNLPLQQAQSMQKTNPEMVQIKIIGGACGTLDTRNDVVPFKDIRVRKAMQMAMDLPSLAKNYYGGTADPYPQSITTSYMTGWGFPYSQWPQDLKDEYAYNPTAAKKLLAEAGYPTGFKTNVIFSAEGDLDLLLVIKSYLAEVGIDMEIRTMDTASWSALISGKKGHDQMVNRTGSGIYGMVNEPLKQLARLLTGSGGNYPMIQDPVWDAFYPAAMSATTVDEVKQIVKKANEYATRQHFSVSLVQPNSFTVVQPWFKGYSGQMGSVSMGGFLNAFYLGRFWIDQKLKKSMGY